MIAGLTHQLHRRFMNHLLFRHSQFPPLIVIIFIWLYASRIVERIFLFFSTPENMQNACQKPCSADPAGFYSADRAEFLIKIRINLKTIICVYAAPAQFRQLLQKE